MEMKIFQTIKTNFIGMGFMPIRSSPKRPLMNITIFFGFIVLAFTCTSECIQLQQATDFEVYVQLIYITSATIMFVVIYTATVFKIPYFYRFINTYQTVINASK